MAGTEVKQKRRCLTCGELKPIEQFHRNYWSKGGRLAHCNVCANAKRSTKRLAEVGELKASLKLYPYRVLLVGGPWSEAAYPVMKPPSDPTIELVRNSWEVSKKTGDLIELVKGTHVYRFVEASRMPWAEVTTSGFRRDVERLTYVFEHEDRDAAL